MGGMDARDDADSGDVPHPPIVAVGDTRAAEALAAGSVIGLPAMGGYCLAMRAGSAEVEARLVELAADPEGPHYAVGQADALRSLSPGWTEELGKLLERCWPGPVEVFVPRSSEGDESTGGAHAEGSTGTVSGGWAVVVGMPDGRALRRLCREQGPWRTVPLSFTEAHEVAQAFDAADVALVIDGGRRDGPQPTLVDATVSPIRVLREGALPASFIEGTMLMSTRRRWFSRKKGSETG
jgi:tRNA A37 threonylcarbamoyladenosine synthetase subunit TsaC/SUA5/YrdC